VVVKSSALCALSARCDPSTSPSPLSFLLPPPSHPPSPEGCFYSQNLPSLLPPTALNPQPTDVVLDMCCAPGGKTSHLASLLLANASPDNSPSGFIVCCDRSKSKVSKVKHLMVDQVSQAIGLRRTQ